MGESYKFKCTNCSYEYHLYYPFLFYWNDNSKKVEKHLHLFSLADVIKKINANLLGSIKDLYCYNCKEMVTSFIFDDRYKYRSSEKENALNYINNKIKFKLIKYSNSYQEEDSLFVDYCPVCNNEISVLKEDSKCPKCEKGILELECMASVD